MVKFWNNKNLFAFDKDKITMFKLDMEQQPLRFLGHKRKAGS